LKPVCVGWNSQVGEGFEDFGFVDKELNLIPGEVVAEPEDFDYDGKLGVQVIGKEGLSSGFAAQDAFDLIAVCPDLLDESAWAWVSHDG
jgi:hypothetical protein